MLQLSIKQAESIAEKNQHLRGKRIENFTVQVIRTTANEDTKSYFVEVVYKFDNKMGSDTKELVDFCETYKQSYTIIPDDF